RSFKYACGANWNRGASVCSNALMAYMAAADAAVHQTIRREVLRPRVVSRALTAALDALQNERDDGGRLRRLEQQLARVRRELGTLSEPAARGGAVQAVSDALAPRRRTPADRGRRRRAAATAGDMSFNPPRAAHGSVDSWANGRGR